jgi:metal ion ABC transporter membrane protein
MMGIGEWLWDRFLDISDATGLTGAFGEGTWFDNRAVRLKMGPAIDETLYMTFVSGAITVVLGLALGIALVSTGHRGLIRNQAVYQVLSAIVNVGRSMPFLILMIAIIPLTRLLVSDTTSWQAAAVPLTIGAIPFYARLAETALDGVEQGKIEAALMLGASRIQITFGVLVREALPSLIQAATVTLVTLLGYSAMAASIGAGGLGALALQYGYQRYQNDVMILTVIVIVLIVGVIQVIGDMLSRLADHR